MSRAGMPRSRAEREESHQKWVRQHYLEEGRAYTFELSHLWIDGYTLLGSKRMRWSAYIKQAECPWSGCAVSPHFRFKGQAEQWARDYLRRGGPPEGYFDSPPRDPNEVVFTRGAG
jgi:hypothetical protein